jgi:TolA-binding protein
MAVVLGLSLLFPGWVQAQKPVKQIQNEYRKNVTNYIQDLDDNFAVRYVHHEQYLIDLITALRQELTYRKSKGMPLGTGGQVSGSDRRDSVRVHLSQLGKALREMKRQNRLSAEYNSRAAIQELHLRYQKLYGEDLELARMEAQAIRQRLLTAGDPANLFYQQLALALRRYKEENFKTAALEFEDLYAAYQSFYTQWDDILFHLGECFFRLSDFENAETYYAKVTRDFPGSAYRERAFLKLVTIAYIETNRTKMLKYFGDFETQVTPRPADDRLYNRVLFMAACTYFSNGDYTSAIPVLEKITPVSSLYYSARYLMGHCYANQESFSAALETFDRVAQAKEKGKRLNRALLRQLQHLSLLKAAFIQFEQNFNGQKLRNVYPLVKNVPIDSDFHDVALLTAAWAAFKDNNVDTARMFIDSLVRSYPASETIFEGKTLLGNLQVLDPRLSDKDRELLAVDAYDYVARAMEAKYLADQFIIERDSILHVLEALSEARAMAGLRGDSLTYLKYDGIYSILETSLLNNGFTKAAKSDARSMNFYQTISNMISQVRLTESQLQAAREANDQKQVESLEKKLDDQLKDLQELGGERYLAVVIPGLSSTGDSQDLEAVLAMRNDAVDRVRQKVRQEKQQIEGRLAETDRLINKAKQTGKASEQERLEEQKSKLNTTLNEVLEFERWVNGLEVLDVAAVRELTGQAGSSSVLGEEFSRVAIDNYSNLEIQNYFMLHKMSRTISEIEARNRAAAVLREKLTQEKDLVRRQLDRVDQLMGEAQNKNHHPVLIRLQFEKNKLIDLYNRINDYEIRLLTQEEVESYADLDVWGDFASYGRNNITYVINTTKIESINDLSRAISQIDKILLARKKTYEARIVQIEEEIKRKEQEIRDKELQELRASQKQYYEKEFFLFKTSEKPEEDPYDYNDLVPDVIDVKAIEDSLKKLEKPIEQPVEEVIETVDTTTFDTTGLFGGSPTDTSAGAKPVMEETTSDTASAPVDTTSAPVMEDTSKEMKDTISTAPVDSAAMEKTEEKPEGEDVGSAGWTRFGRRLAGTVRNCSPFLDPRRRYDGYRYQASLV